MTSESEGLKSEVEGPVRVHLGEEQWDSSCQGQPGNHMFDSAGNGSYVEYTVLHSDYGAMHCLEAAVGYLSVPAAVKSGATAHNSGSHIPAIEACLVAVCPVLHMAP